MYNNNDEFYEVNDLDEDIRRREQLLEEAKNIDVEADLSEALHAASELKRKWKRIFYWESAYEDKLIEEFEGYLDAIYGVRKEGYEKNKETKEELLKQATILANSDQWNKATEEMNALLEQWKVAGFTGKESDDQLWQAFNEARQKFFDRKRKHWEEMQLQFANAHQVKEDLIKQAAAIMDNEEWNKTSEIYKELLEQWKAVGSAGRKYEDKLWNAFQANRQHFFDRRNAYYDELHEMQEERYKAKKALIDQAAEIVACNAYTHEHTEKMRSFGEEWKKIGFCGKDKEDKIWKKFRATMDAYFHGLKAVNEQKHAEWRQRMLSTRNRKQELIATQTRQIKYMQNEMVGLLGQRAIDEMEESIEDKRAFIQELEADITDIDKKLEE